MLRLAAATSRTAASRSATSCSPITAGRSVSIRRARSALTPPASPTL
ncbi:hypothetical protein [Actinokineospora sp.]